MKRISILAIMIVCLLSSNALEAKASDLETLIAQDNTQLFSNEAKASDNILREVAIDKTTFYIHYQLQSAGQVYCEDEQTPVGHTTTLSLTPQIEIASLIGDEPKYNVSTTCSFTDGSMMDKKVRFHSTVAKIYMLKDGRTIFSFFGHTTSLGDVYYEILSESMLTKLSTNKAKIISSTGLLMNGIDLEPSIELANHAGTAALNTHSLMNADLNPEFGGLKHMKVETLSKWEL